MEINVNNLLSINNVLADVLVAVDDEAMQKLTPGFYRSQVKLGLDELGFDVGFLKVTEDIELPEDLILDTPKGCYNLNNINVYTGTPDSVGYVENVYWRKGATTRGPATGTVANINEWNVTDPFFKVNVNASSLYYFTVQNGIIRLSPACSGFDYVRLVFNGIPSGNMDEIAMVPPEVRKAVVLWATEKCAGFLKLRDARYRTIEMDAAARLGEYSLNGAWHEAKMRLNALDTKKLKDAIKYNNRLMD